MKTESHLDIEDIDGVGSWPTSHLKERYNTYRNSLLNLNESNRYIFEDLKDGKKYTRVMPIYHYSRRYNRWVIVDSGKRSDGVTGGFDINSDAWWIHDELCDKCQFADGTPATNWQASWVYADKLWDDGYRYRSVYHWFLVFFLGCKKCRKNGMLRLRR